MPLTFALKWNFDYKSQKLHQVGGKDFTAAHAIALLRVALFQKNSEGKPFFNGTGALKDEIDSGTARVISGPHKTSGGDTRQHITVHCARGHVTYHVYISKNGNCSGVSQEAANPTKKPGHVNDDWNAPVIADSAAL
ncbi:hypothetical protein [Sandarakinorhabdus sp.]|uniref:hypothetical protein n=1 Tax=Sandarakinorhabdus sp. TaxID=1916663 RepID=UPI00286E833A|nr:hypothetical protein [Sandarakinorhabdus sp.]